MENSWTQIHFKEEPNKEKKDSENLQFYIRMICMGIFWQRSKKAMAN